MVQLVGQSIGAVISFLTSVSEIQDETVLIGSLLLFIPLAALLPHIREPAYRRCYSSAIGAVMVILLFGDELWCFLALVISGYVLTRWLANARCSCTGFAVVGLCFTFANIVRLLAWKGFITLSLRSDVAFYMLTLRLGAFAFLTQDNTVGKQQWTMPSWRDFCDFILFFPCMWSGPSLTYPLIMDTLTQPAPPSPPSLADMATFAVHRAFDSGLHFFGYFVLVPLFPLNGLLSPSFRTAPLWWRLAYVCVPVFGKRCQIVMAWYFAEVACFAAGLGLQKQGNKYAYLHMGLLSAFTSGDALGDDRSPVNVGSRNSSDEKLSERRGDFLAFDWRVEISEDMRLLVRRWNTSVQTWLAYNVYKRLPIRSKLVKRLITLTVGAFWHGISPGFYMSFCLYPFADFCQELAGWHAVWPGESLPALKLLIKLVRVLGTQILLNSLLLPFVLLDFHSSLLAWYHCDLLPFWFMGALLLFGMARSALAGPTYGSHKQKQQADAAAGAATARGLNGREKDIKGS
ncbi:unnamed protein product [Vitrella brassicaformis CCMP3155]|uniref:Uncharacterized protein n=1 Tax=Vitrella brassicaformis (strain CCMP3155) TaxID=1169540 RepID=A0A0G4GK93_VITBC|nr:unnamed protein product [Vitrella brassicaformis CCMP3155]|eukprot:CEM30317.1 unnamed protein product [Vitrella brassicaformis CCMP3155]